MLGEVFFNEDMKMDLKEANPRGQPSTKEEEEQTKNGSFIHQGQEDTCSLAGRGSKD